MPYLPILYILMFPSCSDLALFSEMCSQFFRFRCWSFYIFPFTLTYKSLKKSVLLFWGFWSIVFENEKLCYFWTDFTFLSRLTFSKIILEFIVWLIVYLLRLIVFRCKEVRLFYLIRKDFEEVSLIFFLLLLFVYLIFFLLLMMKAMYLNLGDIWCESGKLIVAFDLILSMLMHWICSFLRDKLILFIHGFNII